MNKGTLISRLLISNYNNKHIMNKILRRKCNTLVKQSEENVKILSTKDISEEIDFSSEIKAMKIAEQENILKPCTEDISHIAPFFQPTFNFAAYVNKSETLKKLVDLGVDLHKIEKKKSAPEFIMKLDFEKVMKPYLFFLHDLGVTPEDLAVFITKNPFIFQEQLEDLQIRINYLESKRFNAENITRIVSENPYWLMFSTKRIDNRLGHFQKTFSLTGNEVRQLTTKQPKLITYNIAHVKLNTFSVKEEMGFDGEQIKKLLLALPKLWMMSQNKILKSFNYIHNTMQISHEQLIVQPRILLCRPFIIQHRHEFLLKLNRAQYDPKKENYICLEDLVKGTDQEFCANIAKSSVHAYNEFLKTL